MTKLNIGMIGAGFIGQLAHLINFVEVPHCNLLALAEHKPELRRKVAARFDIPRTYSSHLELLADKDIDAVIVVTPRPLTGPIVLDCLRARKHVLSEKPMAGSSVQAKILLDEANKHNLHYAVGYMKRYDEGVEIAKSMLVDALQTGGLGQILSVHATCYMGSSYCNAYGHIITDEKPPEAFTGWNIAPDWLSDNYHAQFGAYLNTHSHVTNLLRYLFDELPTIEFVNLTEYGGQLAILKFKNVLASLQTGKMSHRGWSEEIKITFSDGEIYLALPPALLRNVPATVELYRAGKIQEYLRPAVNWSWAFRRQAEEFIQDILDKKPSRISAEEAYQEILLIEQMWQTEMQRIKLHNNTEMYA